MLTNNTLYHERQRGNYCRLHAINNLIGKQICALPTFDRLCDEYDNINKFDKGSSKRLHIFYNNGNSYNNFGYVLNKCGYKTKMTHYDYYNNKTVNHNSKTLGFILYSNSHAFCIRKYQNKFYLIDSLRPKEIIVDPLTYCNRGNMGVIRVDE